MIVLAVLINSFTWRGQAVARNTERSNEGVSQTPFPPTWVDKESMKKVVAEPLHTKVVLSCKASGHPRPEIKWTKDGIKIADDNVQKQDAFNYYRVRKT